MISRSNPRKIEKPYYHSDLQCPFCKKVGWVYKDLAWHILKEHVTGQ